MTFKATLDKCGVFYLIDTVADRSFSQNGDQHINVLLRYDEVH